MAKQVTLFGKIIPDKKVIYKNPKNEYEEFVNCFLQSNEGKCFSMQKVKEKADAKWKELKGNSEARKEFIEKWREKKNGNATVSTKVSAWQVIATSKDKGNVEEKKEEMKISIEETQQPKENNEQEASAVPQVSEHPMESSDKSSLPDNAVIKFVMEEVQFTGSSDRILSYLKQEKLFMTFYQVSVIYTEFKRLKLMWNSGQSRKRKTKLSVLVSDVEGSISSLNKSLLNLSMIKVEDQWSNLELKNAVEERAKIILVIGSQISCLRNQLSTKLLEQMRHRIAQQKKTKEATMYDLPKDDMILSSATSSTVSWVEAISRLIEAENGGKVEKPLSIARLIEAGALIEHSVAISLTLFMEHFSLQLNQMNHVHAQMLSKFPIILAQSHTMSYFVNIHQINGFTSLEKLFPMNKKPTTVVPTCDNVSQKVSVEASDQVTQEEEVSVQGKQGRKRTEEKFPQLVHLLSEVVKQHGFQAQERRRISTGKTSGVTLKELQIILLETVPELVSICTRTIAHMFQPPRQNMNSAKHYRAIIDAKVGRLNNNVRKERKERHFLFSRVANRRELASQYSASYHVLSCDDMNKLNIGIPMVSRYHQIRKFYPCNDLPESPDHDFPVAAGYKIIPSGYMFLEHAHGQVDYLDDNTIHDSLEDAAEIANNIIKRNAESLPDEDSHIIDKCGRRHLRYPHLGESNIVLHSAKYHPSSAEMHISHLSKILHVKNTKPCILILCDSGPDWDPSSLNNCYNFYRLFQELSLDILTVTTYAAGYSAFNPIEHLWSKASDAGAGVVLSPTLPDETLPPFSQELSQEELKKKECELFTRCMKEVADGCWRSLEFGKFPTSVISPSCDVNNLSAPLLFKDESFVREYLHAPINSIETKDGRFSTIHASFRRMLRHLDRRFNEVTFMKCGDGSCCNQWEAEGVKSFLQKYGGRLPDPIPDVNFEGHFSTFLERPVGDSDADKCHPVAMEKNLGKCPVCPSYHFLSQAEKVRHLSVYHRAYTKANGGISKLAPQIKVCNFKRKSGEKCGLVFSSNHKLAIHRLKEGHNLYGKTAPSKKLVISEKKKENRRRKYREAFADSDSSDQETIVAEEEATDDACVLCEGRYSDPVWLLCEKDDCNNWVHASCDGMDVDNKDEIPETYHFTCPQCN